MNMTKAYYCLYKMNIRSIVQKEKKKKNRRSTVSFFQKKKGEIEDALPSTPRDYRGLLLVEPGYWSNLPSVKPLPLAKLLLFEALPLVELLLVEPCIVESRSARLSEQTEVF